jgi:hypothetical protein
VWIGGSGDMAAYWTQRLKDLLQIGSTMRLCRVSERAVPGANVKNPPGFGWSLGLLYKIPGL